MSNILVACFSAEGHTEPLAKRLSSAIGADYYAIVPEKPYTKADVKWTNPLARCNRERLAGKDVPLAGAVENFDSYDTVFLGFPIWYGGAPLAVSTFVKAYDWSGKKVVLFATSGGGGMGKTAERLKGAVRGAGEIAGEKLFPSAAPESELKAWAEKYI